MAKIKAYSNPTGLDNVTLYNAIYAESPTLQNRYPKGTITNLTTIGSNVQRDELAQNEIALGMLSIVARIIVSPNTISNPLEDMILGGEYFEFGDIIEKVKVHVAKAVDPMYLAAHKKNGESIDPFIQNYPEVGVEFFKSNLALQYLITTDTWNWARAFSTEGGLDGLVGNMLESVINARNIDLFQAGKNLIDEYINSEDHTLLDTQVLNVDDVTDETSGKAFILAVKNVINALSFPTEAFNPDHFISTSNSDTLTMYVRPNVMNNISVNTLAGAFNRDDLDLTPVDGTGRMRIKTLDNFGGIKATKTSDGSDLHAIYDKVGSFAGYADSDDQPVAKSDITFVDTNADVIAVIAAPRAFSIALRKQANRVVPNYRGEYTNYITNMEYWTMYSNQENVIVIKKKS